MIKLRITLKTTAICLAASIMFEGLAFAEEITYISQGPGITVQNPSTGSEGPRTGGGSINDDDYFYSQCQSIASAEIAKGMMTTVTVPVWRLKGGVKSSGTVQITINSVLAEEIKHIFQEIYDGPQQFPISDAGGFSWRGEDSKSEHNWGTALDLNSNSNYCLYADGTVVGDHWTPGEDPYSFSADCDVVKAFKNHGFAWGGDWPWANRDYMHFSYFGK